MVYLRDVAIENLEKLGKGGAFGIVYKLNDSFAIKVYRPEVKALFGERVPNPVLRKKTRALKIRRIGRDLEYTDLVQDLLYINGKYAGVVIPYYNGTTLDQIMDSPFELKMNISHKLIRNCRELTEHHIYPLDFKLNNMMYVDGEVKLIDLDDTFTKYFLFANRILERDSIGGLDESIKTLFGEYRYNPYNDILGYYLSKERPDTSHSYKGIEEYLSDKDKGEDYLFIDTSSDIGVIKNLRRDKKYRIVLLFDEDKYDGEHFVDFFDKLDMNGLVVYDMIRRTDFDNFFTNNKVKSKQFVKRKEFITIK